MAAVQLEVQPANLLNSADVLETGLEIDRYTRQLHDHIHITMIDVKCSRSGMAVTVDFEAPFSGVIYSKGYFNDPKCR